jgi:adenylate cyclase
MVTIFFGDGVNIAARLQEIAAPGGVCISSRVHDDVRDRLDTVFENGGSQALKNIARSVQVWRWTPGWSVSTAVAPPVASLGLPDKPSIAVLPFQNMSGDPEQEYFADGMVEDIITALSRFRWLFVIARNSSFVYKGKAVDIKQVGRELGVRYVLEGSVRNASGRVRITGQLIDTMTAAHLWADRFEGGLSDIFALQDEVTVNVVSAIQPTLLRTEIESALRRRPEDLTAYDLYLRAGAHFYTMTREGAVEALRLLSRSLEIDPRNGFVASLAGGCHIHNVSQGWALDPQREIAEGIRLLQLALSLDENDADSLSIVGRVRAYMLGDFEATIEMVDRAVSLNPNSALAWEQRGWTYEYAGQSEEAIRSFQRAMRLSPLDPMLFSMLTGMSLSYISLGRFDKAVEVARRAARRNQNYPSTYRCLAAALAHLGQAEEASAAAAKLMELDPDFRISTWAKRSGDWRGQVYVDGLRKAGLPE